MTALHRPSDEAALAAIDRDATAPFRIEGGGTRGLGPAQGAHATLSLAGLSGITLHEPGALTLIARSGTPIAEIEARLRAEGQRLAFEPMDHRPLLGTGGEPTIGGVFAANISGPRRVQVGAARDFLLGVRFVDGSGTVIANGGRVMKNVTGYDLVKLLAGSCGTLGVLTEVSFKVLPDVETAATLRLTGLPLDRAVAAMTSALGSPYEVSGAAHDPDEGITRLRIEGFGRSVSYRAGRLSDWLAPFGRAEVDLDRAAVDRTWAAIRNVTDFAGRPGDVWRLSVKATEAPAIIARSGAIATRLDWGGALLWALVEPGTDLRSRLDPLTGHATLVRASTETRAALGTFHPEAPAVAALGQALRSRFDPRGLFNPRPRGI